MFGEVCDNPAAERIDMPVGDIGKKFRIVDDREPVIIDVLIRRGDWVMLRKRVKMSKEDYASGLFSWCEKWGLPGCPKAP